MTIASMDFFTVLSRFDVTTLTRRLHQKPELYFHLINSYANLMRANLEREKFDFNQKQAEARQRERQQKLRACKPILLTGATLHNLSRALSSSRQREEAESSPQLLSAPAPGIRLSRSVTSTGNTGVSDIREFAPRTPNYEPQPPEPLLDQSDHIWTDEPADDLVCCPS